MRGDRGDGLLQIDRSLLLVNQQNHFAERDAADVLHRSRGEIRQADQVQLSVGILDPEIFVVVADDVFRRLEREFAHLFLARRAVDADRNAVDRAFDVFEVAHDQRRQIRRHLRRGRELHSVLVARSGRVGHDFVVGDRDLSFVGDGGDVERRFVVGLVKRGEGAPRVGGFKLRGGVLASLIVFAQIQAAHLAVEDAGVGNVDGRRAGGQRLLDRQHNHFLIFFGRDLRLLVVPPLVMVISWKSMSTAFSVISEVGFSTRIAMVSSPSNLALSRSGVKISL